MPAELMKLKFVRSLSVCGIYYVNFFQILQVVVASPRPYAQKFFEL